MIMRETLLPWVGQNVYRKGYRQGLGRWLARPFARGGGQRLLVAYASNRISFSQVFPLLWYSPALAERYRCQIRFVPIEGLLAGGRLSHRGADRILIQPWFDVSHEQLAGLLSGLRAGAPTARIGFLDSYAHSDLRLAGILEPFVDIYYKKSLFIDPEEYRKPFYGDTNLTDYYGHLFHIQSEQVDWQVPPAFLDRLSLWPGFFTAPSLLPGFLKGPPDLRADRPIDIHARLARSGSGWYQAMRQASIRSLAPMQDLAIVSEGNVGWKAFMAEMRQSRLCFSPFGYGELCWRDVEGFLTGSVVVKPDMSHLRTDPNLYEPWVTYIPVAWDFRDVEPVVRRALKDDALLRQIAATAFERIAQYLTSTAFVDRIGAELLGDRPGT
jgi:hypothetical protein